MAIFTDIDFVLMGEGVESQASGLSEACPVQTGKKENGYLEVLEKVTMGVSLRLSLGVTECAKFSVSAIP